MQAVSLNNCMQTSVKKYWYYCKHTKTLCRILRFKIYVLWSQIISTIENNNNFYELNFMLSNLHLDFNSRNYDKWTIIIISEMITFFILKLL